MNKTTYSKNIDINDVFNNVNKGDIDSVFKKINKAIGVICGVHRHAHPALVG